MTALLLLIFCLLLGTLIAHLANPPPTLAASLNWWVLNIALPALVLSLVPHLHAEWNLWYLPVSMWLVFAGAWALFAFLGRLFQWSRARIGALTLVCGLGNTAFVGYPLLEALHGQQGVALGTIADQLGCFMMLVIGGAIVTSVYSGAKVQAATLIKRVVTFPAFVAFIVGIGIGALGGWPAAIEGIATRLGATLTPLALFSVGLQIRFVYPQQQMGALLAGLAWKLALAPALIFLIGTLFGVGGMTLTVSVLQAAMAPMISAAILAEQHQLEPKLANWVLVVGIVLSFATVPLIDGLL